MPVRPMLGALLAAALLAGCTSGGADAPTKSAAVTGPRSSSTQAAPSVAPAPSTSTRTTSSPPPAPKSTATSTSAAGDRLPLTYSTGSARQVITVVASSESDTQATLQAWRKVGGGWQRVGPSMPAWLGTDGMTTHPSEQLSATPMGSFTMTQAFGHNSNPGTALPYVHTGPADWWISQAGPLYNTMQHCVAQCAFAQGDPNEHLYYETPEYYYAAVIDYNRAPVVPGAGSAFFLHVSAGKPTAGCVSIVLTQLVRIMRWLDPSQHPRILIGTG